MLQRAIRNRMWRLHIRFLGHALLVLAFGCGVAGLAGCSKSDEHAQAPTQQSSPQAAAAPTAVAAIAASPAAPIDTCALLTSEEIAAVQGEAVVGTKPSQNAGQGLGMYDCFFTLPTFTNSISLSVTQSGPGPDARDARQSWRDALSGANAKASKDSGPALIVEGVGEEAFWTGNERMGALYVLKGSRYLRISVGGPGDQASKIQKCRTLAEAALNKM